MMTSLLPLTVCIFFVREAIDGGRYGVGPGEEGCPGGEIVGDEDFFTKLVARV
jgi:hypothetical protein